MESENYVKIRQQLISSYSLFTSFSDNEINELAQLANDVSYNPGEVIVSEGDFIDSIYFIVKGRAKVIKQNSTDKGETKNDIIATLGEGDPIGLSSKGFFSEHGRRTATIIALSEIHLLRIDIKNFSNFIKKHAYFDKKIKEVSELFLKLDFIKQSYPFCHLSNDVIYSLAHEIKDVFLPPNTLIFSQGDQSDKGFLIHSGEVEIFTSTLTGEEKQLAVLESSQLLGEAGLLTSSKRNASARTITECHLFVLDYSIFQKLLELNPLFAESMVGFMLNRLRPSRAENIIEHRRTTKDGHVLVTLQNTDLDQYYQLTNETYFIWEQLDGTQTIRDLTIAFFKRFKAFVPDMICSLLYSMAETGFVNIATISLELEKEIEPHTLVEKTTHHLKKIVQNEIVFNKLDPLLTKIYNKGIWLFYTWPLQIVLMCLIITGLFTLFNSYPHIMNVAHQTEPSFILFLILFFPISTVTIFLHEAGHAFTAKKLGYKVQRIGINWSIFSPTAYTDTSQLWLANQNQKIAVDIAGIYVDFLMGSIFSLIALVINPKIAVFFWLFSLFIFFNGFKNLSPIREYDGYFLLTDFLDSYQLRKLSLCWMSNILEKKSIHMFKNHERELYYWGLSLLYLVIYTIFIYLITHALFNIFSINHILFIPTNYISIMLALLIFFISLLNTRNEIVQYQKMQ